MEYRGLVSIEAGGTVTSGTYLWVLRLDPTVNQILEVTGLEIMMGYNDTPQATTIDYELIVASGGAFTGGSAVTVFPHYSGQATNATIRAGALTAPGDLSVEGDKGSIGFPRINDAQFVSLKSLAYLQPGEMFGIRLGNNMIDGDFIRGAISWSEVNQ